MAGRRRGAPRGAARGGASRRETRASGQRTRASAREQPVPQIYREMLAEAGVASSRMTSDAPERPLKRPRSGRRPEDIRAEAARLAESSKAHKSAASDIEQQVGKTVDEDEDEDEDEDIEFEDVEIPQPTIQTTYLSSEEETEGDDIHFEDADVDAGAARQGQVGEGTSQETGTMQLNLTAAKEALTSSKRKKQPLTKEDKERRILIHRMHLLLLLVIVEKRNYWCNDLTVQDTLLPLLPAKTIQFLNPGSNLTQFGQTESLKRGISEAEEIFRERFRITEFGLRRPLWAEDEADLKSIEYPKNIDSCIDKEDFRKAARTLKGSRDVGALLFCALLRAVGVEARLVCSLQPLSFVPGGPTLPKPRMVQTPSKHGPATPAPEPTQTPPSTLPAPIRTRLGHPNATAYQIPDITPPMAVERKSPRQRRADAHIVESAFPVFWAEVLDVGHQKWQPVDAVVTGTHFKPHRLDPPAADRDNTLTYVVAFEQDGAAKDVTRRYAKAYTAKTRRLRIDGPLVPSSMEGAKWWRKALKRYRPRGPASDLDQIEDTELNAAEAREPMPRNIADFKDHPLYALERHLRRHEVLIPGAKVVGTVGAGSKGRLEKIYRRKDVRLSKSVRNWYRIGREIIPGEEPIKVLPKRKSIKRKGRFRHLNDSAESSEDDDPVLGPDPAKGVPLFTFEQTRLYVPPPVVAGRIPKNKFKNLDVYVPSMVPAGGFHFKHPRAGHAAHILGIDYAPALQGFEFKGRQGTAVYNGVVIPVEAIEAVRAVITGFEDLEAQLEEERRSRRALEMWRNWMRTLTIRRRLFEGDDYWGDAELGEFQIPPEEEEDDIEEKERVYDDASQGARRRRRPHIGVVLDDDDEGGGLESEPGGFEPGGFEPGGFEPGGFEPGGFEPGGFEPGGFEPGGFDPVGFNDPGDLEADGYEPDPSRLGHVGPRSFEPGNCEPGGFEVEAEFEGKGKQREPPIFDHSAHELDATQTGGSVDAYGDDTQQPGGFEVEDDVDMADAPTEPVHDITVARDQGPDLILQHPISDEANTDSIAVVGTHEVPLAASAARQSAEADLNVALVNNEGSAEAEAMPEESEDAEQSEAASDVTEEFFMDEDGSLVE